MNTLVYRLLRFGMLCGLSLIVGNALGQSPAFWDWAPRPVMGWNSWDFYGTSINEERAKAQADYMAANLLSHGWTLVTVDIQWYQPTASGFNYINGATLTMDGWGRLTPATNRFPSATNGAGFKPLADYVHGKGLKFGIHMMRGIPRQAVAANTPVKATPYFAQDIADPTSTCSWNPDMYGVDMSKPGAQAYYDSIFELVASWDVDFVKIDDLSRPYHTAEIEAIRKAIDKTGRPIVFSTSPGATPVAQGPHVMQHANQWRISDDFWDNWTALYEQFQRLHDWTPYRGPGHCPDADMLPLGKVEGGSPTATGRWTYFTANEQYTLMSLWAIARSPLIHGGDMTQMDPFTLSLLTNDEVIAVNQYSLHNRQLFRTNNLIAWTADAEGSTNKYLAVFNATGSTAPVPVELFSMGFTNSCSIRSLWDGVELGSFTGTFSPSLAAHRGALYRLAGPSMPVPWLTGAVGGSNRVDLTWETIGTASSYVVKRATAEAGPYVAIASGVTDAVHTDSTVTNGTTYFYKVSAIVGGQETPDSQVRSATPGQVSATVGWNYDNYGTVPGGTAAAGVYRASSWNNSWPSNPTQDLADNTGAASSLDLSYASGSGGSSMTGAHPGQDADGSYNKELLNGYLNASGGGTSSVTLSQIPYSQYSIYIYFSSGVAGRVGTVTDGTTTYSFSTMGSSSISGPNAVLTQTTDTGSGNPAANYAVFTGLSGSVKTITCAVPAGGGIAAFQVVDTTPTSTPSTPFTWNGGGADDNWSTGLNWDGGTPPATSGTRLTFAGSTRTTPTMDANYDVSGLTFSNNASRFTIGTANASTLILAGGVTNHSDNTQTLNVPVSLRAAANLNVAAGSVTLSNSLNRAGNLLTVSGAGNTFLRGPISGSGSLLKQGSGALTIEANSTWDLDQAIAGGFSGPLLAQAGTLTFNNGSSNDVNGELVIGGVLFDGGAGHDAKIVVNNARLNVATWLSIGRGNGLGGVSSDLVLTNGARVTAGNFSAGFNGGNSANKPRASITVNDTSSLVVGATGEAFHIAESDGSDVTFNVNGSGTLSAGGLVNVGMRNAVGVLNINDSATATVGWMRIGSGLDDTSSAQGSVTINGGTLNSEGDIVLAYAGSGANGCRGQMVITNGGTVNIASTTTRWFIVGQYDTAPGQLDVDGGQLNLNANTSLKFSTGNGSTRSTNTVNLDSGSITFYSGNQMNVGGSGLVDLAQSGAVSALNTFNLNGGTLTAPRIGASSTTPTRIFNFNGGTLKAAASGTLMSLGIGNAHAYVRTNGAVIDDGGWNATIATALEHFGGDPTDSGLTKNGNGTLTLSAASTYTGDTTINAGTLALSSSGSIGSSPTIHVASGATFEVAGVTGGYTLGASQTLKGNGTVSGATTILGTVAPGASIGTLTFATAPTLRGTTWMEINRTNAQTADKLVLSSGTLTYGGALTVVNTGSALQAGDTFTLFNAPSYAGVFNGVTLPGLSGGLVWDTSKLWVDGSIAVVVPPNIAERIYALTTENQLISFNSTDPGSILTAHTVSGLQANEKIVGIDFWNGILYGLGDQNHLYTLNVANGAAGLVGSFTPVLNGEAFGFEAEPGGLRLVSNLDQDLVLNYSTAVATVGPTINGSPNPALTGLAYHPGNAQMYVADYYQNTIGLLNTGSGLVSTIGMAGIDFSRHNGFDISSNPGNTAYLASPAASSGLAANLYTVDLTTGSASLVGLIGLVGDNILIRGLAVKAGFVELTSMPVSMIASGNELTLSWPEDHTGWRLEVQTNSLDVGLAGNWSTVPGSDGTNQMSLPISMDNAGVFYRLVYP